MANEHEINISPYNKGNVRNMTDKIELLIQEDRGEGNIPAFAVKYYDTELDMHKDIRQLDKIVKVGPGKYSMKI